MKILLGIGCVLLGACASSPSLLKDTPTLGQIQKTTVAESRELFATTEGWQIWQLTVGEQILCAAVKPATDMPWPEFSKTYRTFHGGGGFYMSIPDNLEEPYFGFYGEHPYRFLSTATVDGTTLTDTDDRDTVLSWQSMNVSFHLATQPSRNAYQDAQETSGMVDFIGVAQALEQMMRCHRR